VPAEADGANEPYQYLVWWLLAGIVLMGLPTVRFHLAHRQYVSWLAPRRNDFGVEMSFLAIVLAATTAHLYEMNYAFFGHARLFYAAPLLIAFAAVGFEALAHVGGPWRPLLAVFGCLPAIAIGMSTGRFDEHMPLKLLPWFVRDPLLPVLALAAVAWWFGCVRHRSVIMMHAGSASLAMALWRVVRPEAPAASLAHSWTTTQVPLRDLATLILYGVAAYLCLCALLRRSRVEGVAAAGVHLAALTLLVWNRIHADVMVILLALSWTWLGVMHLAVRRPQPLLAACGPVALLLAITFAFDFNGELKWFARGHAAGMVVLLLAVGQIWQFTRYRRIGAGAGIAQVPFYIGRWAAGGPNPVASVAVVCAFVLLAAGAAVSWHKKTLLGMMRPGEPSLPPETTP
jgi:hypothetical protein